MRLHHKVAVRNRIQGIVVDSGETHVVCHRKRIQGIGCAGKGRSAQWRCLHTLYAVCDARGIADEHPAIGQKMMGQTDGLSRLQMRQTGQQCILMSLGLSR